MGGIVGLRDVLVVAPAASFHHHHQHQHQESLYSTAAEHPVIPLLTWQQQQHHHPNPNPNPNNAAYFKKPMPPMLDPAGILSAAGSGTAACQDCGNQAKKDCSHNRCRTCCKSRGLDCTTHVKSTWVPAARRRERQISGPGGNADGSSASTSAPKKPRLLSSQTTTTSHTSTSNNTTRSYDTSSSHRDADSLPGNVRAPAVFKCVRVSSVDDEEGEDEYAYQAMVTIGGHVFKGFLYDHGVDEGREYRTAGGATTENNNNSAIPNLSELHLGGRSGGTSSSAAMMTTSDIYGGGGLLGVGGTAYGNQIN